jgi:hypothetical protein
VSKCDKLFGLREKDGPQRIFPGLQNNRYTISDCETKGYGARERLQAHMPGVGAAPVSGSSNWLFALDPLLLKKANRFGNRGIPLGEDAEHIESVSTERFDSGER